VCERVSGQNIARFRSSNHIAGIRRLLVLATLCPASRDVFIFGQNQNATKEKIVNL
jgi:hypothetical protein